MHKVAKALALGVVMVAILYLIWYFAVYKKKSGDKFRDGLCSSPREGFSPSTLPRGRWNLATRATAKAEQDVAGPGDSIAGEFDWTKVACRVPWDPAAVAESQALLRLGSIAVDNYGQTRLQKAITSGQSGKGSLTNSQLIHMMRATSSDLP